MKTKKCIYILFVILLGLTCVSCSRVSKSSDPLLAMSALAIDAERHADDWSANELKEKQRRSVEILSKFNDKKKDYNKDDFRTILKDLKLFSKAIEKSPAYKEQKKERYVDEELKEKGSKISKELVDYFGKVDV